MLNKIRECEVVHPPSEQHLKKRKEAREGSTVRVRDGAALSEIESDFTMVAMPPSKQILVLRAEIGQSTNRMEDVALSQKSNTSNVESFVAQVLGPHTPYQEDARKDEGAMGASPVVDETCSRQVEFDHSTNRGDVVATSEDNMPGKGGARDTQQTKTTSDKKRKDEDKHVILATTTPFESIPHSSPKNVKIRKCNRQCPNIQIETLSCVTMNTDTNLQQGKWKRGLVTLAAEQFLDKTEINQSKKLAREFQHDQYDTEAYIHQLIKEDADHENIPGNLSRTMARGCSPFRMSEQALKRKQANKSEAFYDESGIQRNSQTTMHEASEGTTPGEKLGEEHQLEMNNLPTYNKSQKRKCIQSQSESALSQHSSYVDNPKRNRPLEVFHIGGDSDAENGDACEDCGDQLLGECEQMHGVNN